VQNTLSIAATSVLQALKHQLKIEEYEQEHYNQQHNNVDDKKDDDDIPLSSLSLSKNNDLPLLRRIL